MKRRTSTKSVRIYSYGCLPPRDGRDVFGAELRAANDYYNELVAISRARLEGFRAIRSAARPVLSGIESRLVAIESELELLVSAEDDGARDELKVERKELAAKQKEENAAFAALIKPAQDEYKRRATELADGGGPTVKATANLSTLTEMLDDSRWPDEWKSVARSEAKASADSKAARARRVCSSGTGGLIENAFAVAVKDSAGAPLKFKRFDGEGRIGGQVIRGTEADLLAGNGVAQLLAGEPKISRRTGETLSDPRYRVVRVRHGMKGQSVTTDFPVFLHRPLPSDARITWAWILVRRQGTRVRYQLQLTLETDEIIKRPGGIGEVEIRLGWAQRDGGLAVATTIANGAEVARCVLPDSVTERLNMRKTRFRKIMDEHYVGVNPNRGFRVVDKTQGHGGRSVGGVHRRAVRALRFWSKRAPSLVPVWMTEQTERRGKPPSSLLERMPYWKSHLPLRDVARRWVRELLKEDELRGIWRAWRDERLAAGLDLFAPFKTINRWLLAGGVKRADVRLAVYLEWWRRKDEHLDQWAADAVAKAQGHRKQIYRDFAIDMAGRFERAKINKLDLSGLLQKKHKKDEDHTGVRSQQRDAAPSVMMEVLVTAFGKERIELVEVKREGSGSAKKPVGARKRKASVKAAEAAE